MMDLSSLTIFDYVIFSIIGLSALFALLKGFIQAFLSFFGWIIAAVIAFYSMPYTRSLLEGTFHNKLLINVIAFFSSYIIALIIIAVINYRILYWTRHVRGGAIDLSLGCAFGVMRGLAISCVLFLMITVLSPIFGGTPHHPNQASKEKTTDPIWLTKAQTYQLLKTGSTYVKDLFPEKFHHYLQPPHIVAQSIPRHAPGTTPYRLKESDKKTLENIVQELPKSTLPGAQNLTPQEAANDLTIPKNVELLRAIVAAYREATSAGVVTPEKLAEKDLRALEILLKEASKALYTPAPEEEDLIPHYDPQQQKEIDRLIETIR